MKCTIASRNIKLSSKTTEVVENYLKKIDKLLPALEEDLVQLDLVLKEHKKRGLGNTKNEIYDDELGQVNFKRVNPKLIDPIYFDGTIKIILPHESLVVRLRGGGLDETLHEGFARLLREIKKYKGKHFASNSEYSDRKTIRHE